MLLQSLCYTIMISLVNEQACRQYWTVKISLITLWSVASVRTRSVRPDPLPNRLPRSPLPLLLLRLLVSSILHVVCLLWHSGVCRKTGDMEIWMCRDLKSESAFKSPITMIQPGLCRRVYSRATPGSSGCHVKGPHLRAQRKRDVQICFCGAQMMTSSGLVKDERGEGGSVWQCDAKTEEVK